VSKPKEDPGDALMALVREGYGDRKRIEDAAPKARPNGGAQGLLPLVPPGFGHQDKPLPMSQDPDYMDSSTRLLKALVQHGKILAARQNTSFAMIQNQALYEYILGFQEGLEGRDKE